MNCMIYFQQRTSSLWLPSLKHAQHRSLTFAIRLPPPLKKIIFETNRSNWKVFFFFFPFLFFCVLLLRPNRFWFLCLWLPIAKDSKCVPRLENKPPTSILEWALSGLLGCNYSCVSKCELFSEGQEPASFRIIRFQMQFDHLNYVNRLMG